MLVWIALAIVVGYLVYAWLADRYGPSNNYPPSPRGIPFVGHLIQIMTMSHTESCRLSEQLGGSFMLRLFNIRILFLTTWADTKEAIINQSDVFSAKYAPNHESRLQIRAKETFLFADGLLSREKRRFTLQYLRNFGLDKGRIENVITEEFNRVCAVLDGNLTMSFDAFFFCPFLNIIWGIVAGKTYEFDNEEFLDITRKIQHTFEAERKSLIVGMMPFLKYLPGDPFHFEEFLRCVQNMKEFIEKHMNEHEKSLGDGEPRDFMDAYLSEIRNRERTELKEESVYQRGHMIGGISDILHAGIETTATTLEWSLLYLATWPEIQKKVQHELDTVIGKRRTVYSDNTMLPYVKATIMEVQRFCTVVPICSPRIARRTTKVNDFIVHKGTIVLPCLYAVHREKKVWGDPDVFRPERFLMADGKTDKAASLIPFSVGPRTCIGESLARMELFLFFTGMMQRYSFRRLTGHAPPSLEPVLTLTIHPQPFQLTVRQR